MHFVFRFSSFACGLWPHSVPVCSSCSIEFKYAIFFEQVFLRSVYCTCAGLLALKVCCFGCFEVKLFRLVLSPLSEDGPFDGLMGKSYSSCSGRGSTAD